MTTFTSNPRISQALHNGVITSEQASLLQSFFNVLDYHKHEIRESLMSADLYNAMAALGNMTTPKPPEQLKAEFEIRKYKRLRFLGDYSEFNLAELLPENNLQDNAKLISHTKTMLACALIRSALLRQMHAPSQLSLALCNHPCFSVLFRSEQRQKLLANQAPLNMETLHLHAPLMSLSHQLKAALPALASDFENETGLGQVWQQAVLVLLCSPLPLLLYKNFLAADFAALGLASYQRSVAMQPNHLPVVGKILLYPGRWLAGIYSWCVLRGVVNKHKS